MSRALLLAVALVSTPAFATPALAPIWTDHAVIQRDRPIVIEGSAAPNETPTVTLGTARQTILADADGRFRATFPARKASAAPAELRADDVPRQGAAASDILVDRQSLGEGHRVEVSV